MIIKKIKELELDELSDIMGVHPRTILRAIEDDTNAYWAEGHNPHVKVDKVLKAFDMEYDIFHRAYKGKDRYFKPTEASKYLNLPHRTFVYRKYKAAIRKGGIVRFSRQSIINENVNDYLKL